MSEADENFKKNQQWSLASTDYLTKLSSSEEVNFQKWVKENHVPFDPSAHADYDMRGFWKGLNSGDPHAQTGINRNDHKIHFSDYWKTPYHRSFSAESRWAQSNAPRWNDKDQLVTPKGVVVFDERAKRPTRNITIRRSSVSADELTHTLKQLVDQAIGSRKPFAYGHIATYDPKTGAVKVVYPSLRNEDNTPTMSPWIPLATGWAPPSGQSFGIQFHPVGGASLEEPTKGEQVVVSIMSTNYGTALSAALCFNASAPPPRSDLLPGEMAIQSGEGSFVRFHQLGDIEINTQGNVNIFATDAVQLIAPIINLCKAIGETLQALCTKALFDWAKTHTHSSGGSGPPTSPPPDDSITTVVFGE